MKTKKSTLLVLFALIASLVLSVGCLFTACGTPEEVVQCAITWDIPTGTTVTVEGYEELPETVAKDTELVFTVTTPEGYTPTVKTSTTVSPKEGKYTIKISKDTSITVTANKILNDIAVELLKDVTYYEDNKVDVNSIKVTAKYVLGDEEVTNFTITYLNGTAFIEGDESYTVNFGGKSQTVTLATPVKAAQDFGDAILEVNEDGNPVVVVTGRYNVEGDDKAAAKAAVEDFAKECLERVTWANKTYEAEATINDDFSFELRLTITEWTATAVGNHYYFRYAKNGVVADGQNLDCAVSQATCTPSDNNDDLSLTTYEGEPLIGKGGAKFYIGKCADWGGCVMVVIVNESAPKFTSAGFEMKDSKPYLVLSGTCTTESVEAGTATMLELINHLDMEDAVNGNAKLADFVNEGAIDETKAFFEFDVAAGTFKLYLLLEGDAIQDGSGFFIHLGKQSPDGYYPNLAIATDGSSIEYNGMVYSFTTAADLGLTETWQANLMYIKVAAK